jgi:hypothetical protein
MWKNMLFWLWKVQKGTSSLHRKMENPFKQVSWGEAKFIVKNLNRYSNIITTNTEYTIYPQSKIEETTQYYYQTLEVGQHHTMDPIMEILSCSLASSMGHPPIKLQIQIQYFSSCLITLLELYIVLPSPKNILEEESSRSRTRSPLTFIIYNYHSGPYLII